MEEISELRAQLVALALKLQQNEVIQQQTQLKLSTLEINQNAFQNITVREELEEAQPNYLRAEDIDLAVFNALPVFNGNTKMYRSWRNQVWAIMEQIKMFKDHYKYYHALTIIRTKITGPASDVLTNHNTKMNIYSIINRLDYTYADQRPLYVLNEEMKSITQGRRSLSEFHDAINQALNLIISKLDMSGECKEGIQVQVKYANEDAVRTFIRGLNDQFTRSTLYSHSPKDLEHAYAIALTIHHDSQHQNLNVKYRPEKPRFMPNATVQKDNSDNNHKSTPMEVDESQQFVKQYQPVPQHHQNEHHQQKSFSHQKNNNNFKRERSSNNNSYQNKHQRINQTNQEEDIENLSVHTEDDYESSSVFLGE